MTSHSTKPATATFHATVLVAEDDGPSGEFFKAAFEGLGCRVVLEIDGQAALAQARTHRFDLLLLDCRMPGAGAVRILSALRAEPDAASHAMPAIATSAELDQTQRRELLQMGFTAVLAKPITLVALHALVRPLLPSVAQATATTLDDQAALEHSGTLEAVTALRGLFATELRQLANELDRLAAQPAELAERLHRLLAACGFCGAHALAEACRHLKQEAEGDTAPSTAALERFRETLTRTSQALSGPTKAP